MGCATSKLDQLPAVSLCHDRCNFLEEALQQSYVLADAHVAYMHSLKTLGPTLHRFFDQSLESTSGDDSAVKTAKQPSLVSSPDHSTLSSSNSDSHIQFDTDSEEEEAGQIHQSYILNHGILTSYSLPNHNYHTNTYQNGTEFSGSGWKTPPPPAPRSGAWDYLNFFDESYERYELPHASSKAVKNKEEAPPALEAELLKQIQGGEKPRADYRKEKGEENPSGGETVAVKNGDVESKKKVDSDKPTDLNEPKNPSGKQSVSEVMRELQVLFEKASDSGNEVMKMLDTGKFRYHHKNSVYQGSSKIFHMITSNSSETESLLPKEKIISSVDNDEIVSSQNLSSTLRKLCMWEKKLYDEVKAEEKLRINHAKKCRQIRSLDQKGADARRVHSTRTLIRALSTKMRVAVQVIDKIAITINKLMDEELWPQINELTHRLFAMWKVMLECHSCQCKMVMEAKCFDVIAHNGKLNDTTHLETAITVKLELQNWSLSFSSWIEAQKGYVKALNGWLRRCLLHEPEETTADSTAPPIFVIINRWSEAMDGLSEKEVVEAVNGLLITINQVLEQHNTDLQQKIIADKDFERKVKLLGKEEQKMQKIMQARVKKMTLPLAREENDFLLPTDNTHRSETKEGTSLQYCLKQILMAMEKLAAYSTQAYDELHKCMEELRTSSQANPECP